MVLLVEVESNRRTDGHRETDDVVDFSINLGITQIVSVRGTVLERTYQQGWCNSHERA